MKEKLNGFLQIIMDVIVGVAIYVVLRYTPVYEMISMVDVDKTNLLIVFLTSVGTALFAELVEVKRK